MSTQNRRRKDRLFTLAAYATFAAMGAALLIVLVPLFWRGAGALCFRATSEHRRMEYREFGRGRAEQVRFESARRARLLAPVTNALARFESETLKTAKPAQRRQLRADLRELEAALSKLLGPLPGKPEPALLRDRYGQTRWDRTQEEFRHLLYKEVWDYPLAPDGTPLPGVKRLVPRDEAFKGTPAAEIFPYLQANLDAICAPRPTLYWEFLTSPSKDSHFFGGIWPELFGTLMLTILSMLFAVPAGVLSAVWLTQYAKDGPLLRLVRICINTLAGVPSIVFGLFGLTFFIVTLKVSEGKSLLAGALTLALLILPTIIRASEEALRAVPGGYREAAMSLGASKWRTICTVILPAALPGILTGIVISMGRAAGETAPIIFTAAVSVGGIASLGDLLSSPTPALSWNIYNLVSEHEAANEIRHVQYGMAAALILLVLALNLAAILARARLSRKLKG